MAERRYYVVRTDDEEKQWIWKEMQNGRLRQGWGISGTSLTDNGKAIDEELWCKRYQESSLREWGHDATVDEAVGRYRILSRFRQMTQGDIIVIPKMPEFEGFTLATVSGTYAFDSEPKERRHKSTDDYRHVLAIDPSSCKSFHYASSDDARVVQRMMRAYQSAVNAASNPDFIKAVDALRQKQSDLTPKSNDAMVLNCRERFVKEVHEKLKSMPWHTFEDYVKETFEKAGYKFLQRHHFDGKGGDVDLVFTLGLAIVSEYAENDLKLHIQVKQRPGIDQYDTEGIDQLLKMSIGDKTAISILISNADEFTPACKALAVKNGIILVPGLQFAEMVTKYLTPNTI